MKKDRFAYTNDLTKSFQWTQSQSFQQQDVQEFFQILYDALHQTFIGSKQQTLIHDLF